MSSHLDIPSRAEEENRIVVNALKRLYECTREIPGNLFADAVRKSDVSRHQLQSGEGLTHDHLDRISGYLERKIPDLAFRFYREMELTDLGMLGYAVISCPTVGKALNLLSRYLELTSDRFTERHYIREDYYVIQPLPTWRHFDENISIAEDSLAGNGRAISLILGSDANLSGATAAFAYPAPEHAAAYREYFDPMEVEFDSTVTELRIPKAWLDYPVTTANVTMSDVTTAICERVLGTGSRSHIDTPRAVRRLLLSRPGQHMLRLEEAAEQLRMSTAQLRKRLYRAGTSYKQIVLDVRMALAAHYLESTHLTIQEIAYLLDYAQPGPFSRAFKKYHGRSPSVFRTSTHPAASF